MKYFAGNGPVCPARYPYAEEFYAAAIPDLFVGAPTNDAIAGFAGRAYLFLGPVLSNRTAASANAKITAQAFGDGIQSGRVYLFNGPLSGSFSATQSNATITGIDFEELGWSVHSI